jgi:glycosyltransferase involved in cell wall biosynthesis
VSDYTRAVAHGLAAAGDDVDVWAPACGEAEEIHAGVVVHRLPDRFGSRSRQMLTRHLDRMTGPVRLLVQYVPHAFGYKGANIPFCWWVRSRRRDPIWVMFHEVGYPFERRARLRLNVLAATNRIMASLVAGAARRAFVSIPAWREDVASLAKPGVPVTWLPVPSNISPVIDVRATAIVRARYTRRPSLVGHFGTYGDLMSPLLDGAATALVERSDCDLLLIGRGSVGAARDMTTRFPQLAGRLHASGALDHDDLSAHISACDLMLQPYPDGISTRRTSAMAALAHGRAIVTTAGSLTEQLWAEIGAAMLVPAGDPVLLADAAASLLADPVGREELGRRARRVYTQRFDLCHTIAALRAEA